MSRYAVISDIHGNILALEAVVEDMRERHVSKIINLGDHVSGPLWPQETILYLMSRRWTHIRGNHDRQVSMQDPRSQGPSDNYAFKKSDEDQRKWLCGLPSMAVLDIGMTAFHGAPSDDNAYLLETISDGKTFLSRKTDIEISLRNVHSEIILCGHSHQPRCVRLENGTLVINPGSVGLQAYHVDGEYPHRVEVGSPHARYAILEKNHDTWEVEFILVEYDWARAAEKAGSEKRPDWERALYSGFLS